jgi:predicted Ser/Thr protein kinase
LGGAAAEPSLEEVCAAFPALEVVERLGAGGMGVVFKARQRTLDRWVALKVLPRHLAGDPSFVERFQREARLLARLSHPGIVAVHDFGQAGPFCYLLLEYVDGVTLRQALRTERMTPAQALALVPPICEALQFAHDHGVLHRDIKPENILLDTAGRVKIADFGIAKLVGDPLGDITLTENGARLGTPHYMAPEQIEDPSRVDHRADVYSLGVVFYELLTGELPLGRFAAPSAKSALDARIDDIVLRALAKERELRQQSVGEVKTQVEDVTRRPVAAGAPPSPPPLPSAPAPALSTSRLNWAAGLVAVSLVMVMPSVLVMGYISMGSMTERLVSTATLIPAIVCGLVGLLLAELEVPAFRMSPATAAGRRRLMFALGAWPVLCVQFIAGVLTVGLVLAVGLRLGITRTLTVAAAAAPVAVVATGMILPRFLARHLRGPGSLTPDGGVSRFQAWFHGGLTLLFLWVFSGFFLRMVERDREMERWNRFSQTVHPEAPGVSPLPPGVRYPTGGPPLDYRPDAVATLSPGVRTGTNSAPTAVLHLPAGLSGRLTARLWRDGIEVPEGTMTFNVPGLADRPTDAQIRWNNNRTEGPPRNPDPSWTLLVMESRGAFQRRPQWVEGQPTRWEVGALGTTLVLALDQENPPRSSPVLVGSVPGPEGPVAWWVTLEASLRPLSSPETPQEGEQEWEVARDQLQALQARVARGEIPARGCEILDAEYRERFYRAFLDRNPAAGAQATVDHARAMFAWTEGEHRAGRATADDVERAKAAVKSAVAAAGPRAGDAP